MVLVVVFSLLAPGFFSVNNFISLTRQIAILGVVSTGMTLVLIAGGLDLSVGSQISLIGVLVATLIVNAGVNPILACIIGLICSTIIGYLNSVLIIKTNMWPMITTIAMMQVLQGVAYIITGGLPVYGMPDYMKAIGQGYLGPIPIPVIIMVVIMALGSFILNKTYFGRYLYAIGSNAEAARLSGINITKIKTIVYMICGLLAGIGGLIMMGRVASGQPKAGATFEMDVLTACVVGGVGLNGGKGKMSGVAIGVLIMGVLSNGLGVMGVSEYYQLVCKGAVLLLAVGFDGVQQMRAKSKKTVVV
ncbi:MAG: ABC transporter permease [Oscillospiraceae bacterium]